MSADLDELYFEWLYGQINSVRQKNPARSYWKLFRILYRTEFVWFVPNDDNRVADGRDLRRDCLEQNGIDPETVDLNWLGLECSFLELLVALSRRAAFLTSSDPIEWFWEMLENLRLRQYNDAIGVPEKLVIDILDKVIWRTYTNKGTGGLFPLRRTRRDMRDVELWYQLHAYVEEKGP